MAQVHSIEHFVGGARVQGRSGRTAPVYNPAIGQVVGIVTRAFGI